MRFSNTRQHKKDSPFPLLFSVAPRSIVVGESFGTRKACGTTNALGKKTFKQTQAERLTKVVLNLLLFVNNLATSVDGAANYSASRASFEFQLNRWTFTSIFRMCNYNTLWRWRTWRVLRGRWIRIT